MDKNDSGSGAGKGKGGQSKRSGKGKGKGKNEGKGKGKGNTQEGNGGGDHGKGEGKGKGKSNGSKEGGGKGKGNNRKRNGEESNSYRSGGDPAVADYVSTGGGKGKREISGGGGGGGGGSGGGGGGGGYGRGGERKEKTWNKNGKFDRVMAKMVTNPTDAGTFLRICIDHSDKLDLLFRITSDENGPKNIRAAATFGSLDHVILFLKMLGDDQLSIGLLKEKVLTVVKILFEVRFHERLLAEVSKSNSPYINSAEVSWFVLKVASSSSDARMDRKMRDLKDILISNHAPFSNKLETYFGGGGGGGGGAAESTQEVADITMGDILQVPGGRHDNDKEDFRSISVFPTMEEMNSRDEPFLPSISGNQGLLENSEAALLDRQFRLLREDCMGPMRELLRQLDTSNKNNKYQDKKSHQFHAPTYHQPEFVGIEAGAYGGVACLTMHLRFPPKHKAMVAWQADLNRFEREEARRREKEEEERKKKEVEATATKTAEADQTNGDKRSNSSSTNQNSAHEGGASFQSNTAKNKELLSFWNSKRGSKVLPKDSIIVIAGNDGIEYVFSVKRSPFNEKKPKDIIVDKFGPKISIGVSISDVSMFDSKKQTNHAMLQLSELMKLVGKGPLHNKNVVQASENYFSYAPVLRSLQSMDCVPFAEEIAKSEGSQLTEYLDHVDVEHEISKFEATDGFSFDDAQKSALRLAVKNRVSLTQGPPGTGKTHLGVRLADIIYNHTNEKILCLCFTNHALDDFLGDLVKQGIKDVVRIGGRASDEMQQYNIQELRRSIPRGNKSQSWNRIYGAMKGGLEQCQDSLLRLGEELVACNKGKVSWQSILEYLNDEHDIDVFNVSVEDEEGFVRVGEGGKAMSENYLWNRWVKGLDRGLLKNDIGTSTLTNIRTYWDMSPQDRLMKKEVWVHELTEELRYKCAQLLNENARLSQQLQEHKQDDDRTILQKARVIGCTTTGAAKYKSLLEDAKATVVIIEEAGEVLEAQSLSALQPHMKHLIMIGDHQQLRPKYENYELSVSAKNTDHNFNVSLFERLVKTEHVEYGMLTVQHRMRPEISKLIKRTYPPLRDGPGTLNRPSIVGVKSNVIFIDHNEGEDSTKDGGADIKSNAFEVEMVLSIARYLLQNNYEAGQIVILTPYLGQLYAINAAMARDRTLEGILSDQDEDMLLSQGLDQEEEEVKSSDGTTPLVKKSKIRVATVDNFQGEEADIIIASLVRCNNHGVIGFLNEPERVNVMFSRARDGQIIVGSSQTMQTSKDLGGRLLWSNLLNDLRELGSFYPAGVGFPAICATHGSKPQEPLMSSAAFSRCCPEGGCCQPCNAKLGCGHNCSLLCHTYDRLHTKIKCDQKVFEYCPKQHFMEVCCGTIVDSKDCTTCREIANIEKVVKEREAVHKRKMLNKRNEADKKIHELRTEAQTIRQKIEKLQEEEKALLDETLAKIEVDKVRQELLEREKNSEATSKLQAAEAKLAAEEAIQKEKKKVEEENRRRLEEARKKLNDLEAEKIKNKGELSSLEKQTKKTLEDLESKMNSTIVKGKDALELSAAKNSSLKFRKELYQMVKNQASTGLNACNFLEQYYAKNGSDFFSKSLLFLENLPLSQAISDTLKKSSPPSSSGASDGSGWEDSDLFSSLSRSTALLNKADYLAALEALNQQMNETEKMATSSNRSVYLALIAICSLKLGQPPSEIFIPEENLTGGNDSISQPFWYLAVALKEQIASNSGKDPSLLRRAYGFALASLACKELQAIKQCAILAANLIETCDKYFDISYLKPKTILKKDEELSTLKKRAGTSASLQDLLKLTGIKQVKKKFLDLNDLIGLNKQRGEDITKKQYNVMFTGNPGTGKTTVARLYGAFLKEVGVLPSDIFEETSGAKLLGGGVSMIKDMLDRLHDDGKSPLQNDEKVETDKKQKGSWKPGRVVQTNADGSIDVRYDSVKDGHAVEKNVERDRVRSLEKGGVLFLDEAYQLNPTKNQVGAQILDLLLTDMEEFRGKLVVIFAGYKKHLEDLLEHNEGLPSRFKDTYNFEDFSDQELYNILDSIIKNDLAKYKVSDLKYLRIASKRIGKQRGTNGFGNARAVRNFVERIQERQASRVLVEKGKGAAPDLFELKREDILGPLVKQFHSDALDTLRSQIGLEKVKSSVENFLKILETNAEREENELPVQDVLLNRIFVGNPGTGKTTIAKLLGRIYKDLGLLSKGDLIVKNPSDFIGSALGQSEQKTKKILENSVGCVLLIDEAYGLNPVSNSSLSAADPYKTAAIDTIVAEVQGVPGDDRCVFLCGYVNEMTEFIRNANPGLKRRFQEDNKFVFEDYDNTQLYQILQLMAKSRGVKIPMAAASAAIKELEKKRMKPNFGNGGDVATLLSSAVEKAEKRLSDKSAAERALHNELCASDFQPVEDAKTLAQKANPSSLFDDLVGCEGVRQQIKTMMDVIEDAKQEGRNPLDDIGLNFTFVGPPGTGKTTVARRMQELFETLGLLPGGGDFVQCSVTDLQTGYVGQAGKQTREKFQQARGGVLFIDEAYRLYDGAHGYGREIVDEIVNLLTEDEYRGKMVVILAGYEEQIDEMMRIVNPGLKSRVTETIKFDKFEANDVSTLLKSLLTKKGKSIDSDLLQFKEREGNRCPLIDEISQQLVDSHGFSSGRDVDTWVNRVVQECAKRKAKVVTRDILDHSLQGILRERVASSSTRGIDRLPQDLTRLPMAGASADSPLPPPSQPPQIEVMEEVEEEVQYAEDGDDDDDENSKISAALQKACVDLGYDADLTSRQRLEELLTKVENGSPFPKDIMDYIRKKTNASDSKIDKVLRPQISSLLSTTQASIQFTLDEMARIEALNEAERKKEVAKQAKIQQKLMGICPAGFCWHREGSGWRCGGGAHWVPESEVE